MSIKRGKLTAGKAKERIASLEESIAARQHRLEQLETRLERSESPDERLLTAKTRLERRLVLERDQLEKLLKLLQRDHGQPEESGEFFASEEIDDLHRSFEEIRHNLAQVQARIDSSDVPRDLNNRLSSFEDRVSRREEVDSELFGQVLALQNALDQERQAVRRLTRRAREQDQSLEALREAVEDSVVATVDLAERLDELEENISETTDSKNSSSVTVPQPEAEKLEEFQGTIDSLRLQLLSLQEQMVNSFAVAADERKQLHVEQTQLETRQTQLESTSVSADDTLSSGTQALMNSLLERLEAVEKLASPTALRTETFQDSQPLALRPAVFAKNGSREKPAVFSPCHSESPTALQGASCSSDPFPFRRA